MERTPVISSSIAAVGYDRTTRTLEVEFITGRVYRYFDVPSYVYETIAGGSVSVGQFFNERVRGVYRYARIS